MHKFAAVTRHKNSIKRRHKPAQSPALYSVVQFVAEMWSLVFAAAVAEPAPEP